MKWQGQILEEGPYKASCDGYNLDIDIISEEPVQLKKAATRSNI
jgi:hypothetical protein